MDKETRRVCGEMLLFAALLLALAGCGGAAQNKTLILATTTSTQDSGLLDVLVPLFEEESGYTVQTVAVGTGAALKMAEEGNADVLLVHAPEAEQALMDAGFGAERLLVMHNDFVIVGPSGDLAGAGEVESAAQALAQIAASTVPFVSRGDDSGTHKKELSLWSETSFTPQTGQPNWYVETGQGMGATLIIASERGGYTLTDRATYLANRDNLNLTILFEGDDALKNIYHVITINPAEWPDVNAEGGRAFAQFMVSEAVQAIIGEFGVAEYGQPLFYPDALP